MTRLATTLILAAFVALPSCGTEPADQLEQAAEQSDPAAAAVLRNEAAALEAGDSTPGDAQQALQNAGNVAAAAGNEANAEPSPAVQAKPHSAGDPVPPPKTKTAPQ